MGFVLLAGALIAGCGTTPSPSPSAPPPSPSPSQISCASSDLVATAGPWGGAAGSRGTDVTVKNQGSSPCPLTVSPLVVLDDASGRQLLESGPVPTGSGPTLGPAGTASFSLVFSNWCETSVSLPLHFTLEPPSGTVQIGSLSLTTLDDLPPCNGPAQPALLSATEWQLP